MRIATLSVGLLVLLSGCSPSGKSATSRASEGGGVSIRPYSPPDDSTVSLLTSLEVNRDRVGALVLTGRVLLPPGTKITVYVRHAGAKKDVAQGEAHVGENGAFTTEAFTDAGAPFKRGAYRVEVLSYFNEGWQSPEVLNLVGKDGARIPARLRVPDDMEFPQLAGHMQVVRNVVVPDVPQELVVIEAVKNATLSTPENGRSADPVRGVVAYFESVYAHTDPDNTRVTGWSARQAPINNRGSNVIHQPLPRPGSEGHRGRGGNPSGLTAGLRNALPPTLDRAVTRAFIKRGIRTR